MAMCPKFMSEVCKTIENHESRKHFMEGGSGVSCFIWVTGPAITPKGNPSKKLAKSCFSSNSLDLRPESGFDAAMRNIAGYRSHYVNID